MLTISEGLNTPFWSYLKKFLMERGEGQIRLGVETIPNTAGEVVEREQNFGAGKALAELVNDIPNIINEQLKKLEKEEQEK